MVEESHHENCAADWMSESTRLAQVIVKQILEAGIEDVVISPGSRNAPLSLAFFQASEKGLIKLYLKIDERSAGFFALGIAKATSRAVPLVCTSGSAVANYHPAILEASHTNAPLLLLTADRPARLRRTGANQTTEQARIFGKAVRYFADISGSAYPMELPLNALQSGPVHLNIQFDEPLLDNSDDQSGWLDNLSSNPARTFTRKKSGTFHSKSTRGLLIIGHDRAGLSQDSVNEFAESLGWPVIAEDPLSIPSATSHASLFLASTKVRKEINPDTVVVIGRTTLSRPINALISQARKVIVIDPRMATVDGDRVASQKFLALPSVEVPAADGEWVEQWKKLSQRAGKAVADLTGWSEQIFARDFSATLSNSTTLFISSSRPIRDIEGFATSRTGIKVFANRGLAGIDGNLSTALGIATGIAQSSESAVAVVGDLAFLHDVGALASAGKINLRIFVIDNNGGGIFSTLPQAGVNGFEEVFGTPHNKDLAAIASGFGIATSKIASPQELAKVMATPISQLEVVIVDVPNRAENAQGIKSIFAKMDSL
jgi:2-succinyl-5-enolpyruvyl-6-hydroxy-3-cyclohexene-1-carboxylate synthase